MAAFTTIAAGVGMATTLGGATASFIQAGKQRNLQRKAEAEAEKAMAEARKQLEVNYYEQLGINKEVYETEREAQNVAAAQIVEAARESDRGAEATAGRVLLASQEAQKDITKRMAEEKQALDIAKASEESRLRDVGVQLSLEEVAGGQLAAAQSQEMAGQAMQQGFQGVASLGQQVAAAAPLYAKAKMPKSPTLDASQVYSPTAQAVPKSPMTAISPSMVSPTPSRIVMPMQGISPLAGVGVPQQLPMTGGYIDWSSLLGYK